MLFFFGSDKIQLFQSTKVEMRTWISTFRIWNSDTENCSTLLYKQSESDQFLMSNLQKTFKCFNFYLSNLDVNCLVENFDLVDQVC